MAIATTIDTPAAPEAVTKAMTSRKYELRLAVVL
jgi:hypothetical protein